LTFYKKIDTFSDMAAQVELRAQEAQEGINLIKITPKDLNKLLEGAEFAFAEMYLPQRAQPQLPEGYAWRSFNYAVDPEFPDMQYGAIYNPDTHTVRTYNLGGSQRRQLAIDHTPNTFLVPGTTVVAEVTSLAA